MAKIWEKILYAQTKKNGIKTWSIKVVDNTLYGNPSESAIITITIKNGTDHKEIVRSEVISEGKNIGKANETTPREQALSEALSRYNEKLKEGYSTKVPTITSDGNLNLLGLRQPMLAHKFEPSKFEVNTNIDCYIQPKLDGHRALLTCKNGELIMYSRKGTRITTMNHILKDINPKILEGQYLDGELYIHGKKLQKISSCITKYQKGLTEQIKYHVYDTINDNYFKERFLIFKDLCRQINSQHIEVVYTSYVDELDNILARTNEFIKEGYEGAILRLNNCGYESNRSHQLLKIKKFDDSEYKILNIRPGKALDYKGSDFNYIPGVLQLQTKEGKLFEVYAPGTLSEKCRFLSNKNDYIGKEITVKHSGFTEDGIPWHPVALRIKEDI